MEFEVGQVFTEPPIEVKSIFYVYQLSDPITGVVCYVGSTASLVHRYRAHLGKSENSGNSKKAVWTRAILSAGLFPKLEVVGKFSTESEAVELELEIYNKYRDQLFNRIPPKLSTARSKTTPSQFLGKTRIASTVSGGAA